MAAQGHDTRKYSDVADQFSHMAMWYILGKVMCNSCLISWKQAMKISAVYQQYDNTNSEMVLKQLLKLL